MRIVDKIPPKVQNKGHITKSYDPTHPRVLRIPPENKARLNVMFLAKHATSDGSLDQEDGSHAIYHHEIRTSLEAIGLNITLANHYEAIHERPDSDFVITLLNRGGFQNSEMLAPLLLTKHGVPFLGASPIVRGLADDKHLMKVVSQHRGVPTAPWCVFRRGTYPYAPPSFNYDRLIVKPNASSASWGIGIYEDWAAAAKHVVTLHQQGHDVIVEPWIDLYDIGVPVIGSDGAWILPPLSYFPDETGCLRSYEEKRNLVHTKEDPLVPVKDAALCERLESYTQMLIAELWPFDYGRFEFRYNPKTDEILFMEVNLSCNLWSKKTISRSARTLGIDHTSLVETIVAHSMARQGLIDIEKALHMP